MKKNNNLIKLLIFIFILIITIIKTYASSSDLTINFDKETTFKLYKIATIENNNTIIDDRYKSYSLDFSDVKELSLTLLYITNAYNIKEDYSGITKDGELVIENIENGLYLVIGDPIILNNKKIEIMPHIININNDKTLIPKYEEHNLGKYELSVFKTWNDDSNTHPEVIVQLYNGNNLIQEITLNSANAYRYVFKDLDRKYNYYIIEKNVPDDYTMHITKQNDSIIIENKKTTTMPPDEKIPQTGQVWYPLPYLCLLSMILGILAFKTKFKKTFMILSLLSLILGLMLLINNATEDIQAKNSSESIISDLKAEMEKKIIDQKDNFTEELLLDDLKELEDVVFEMPEIEIDNIKCIGVLDIPSVNCNLPIAKEWNYDILKKMPGIYYGNYYNKLIIAGHNYKTGQFGVLKNVKIGDSVFITTVDNDIIEYKVETIEILNDTDVEKMINTEYDLTLFTCTYNGKKRLTIRCNKTNN